MGETEQIILMMYYSDGSGTPAICPFKLTEREVQIAKWVIDHAMMTEATFTPLTPFEDNADD